MASPKAKGISKQTQQILFIAGYVNVQLQTIGAVAQQYFSNKVSTEYVQLVRRKKRHF